MRTVSTDLQLVMFGENIAWRANAYFLALAGPLQGTTLRLTDGDQNFLLGGELYQSGPTFTGDPSALPLSLAAPLGGSTYPGDGMTPPTESELESEFDENYVAPTLGVISRGRSRQASDLSVDDVDVTLNLTALANGLGVTVNALLGSFDGCAVTIWKCFMGVYGDASANGAVLDVQGYGYPADIGSTQLRLTVKGIVDSLATPLPKRLFQAHCPYAFGDSRCTVNLGSYMTLCTVGEGRTRTSLPLASGSATHASPYSYVRFTSGICAGMVRHIKSDANATPILLGVSLAKTPAVGDSFYVVRGCNKTRNGWTDPLGVSPPDLTHDCLSYGNLVNFGGFPDVPAEALSGGA